MKQGSKYELNISFYQREELRNVMDDLNVFLALNMNYQELMVILDGCKNEMRRLLNYSLVRFNNQLLGRIVVSVKSISE